MSESQKPSYPASADNIFQASFSPTDKSISTSSFVTGLIGRKISISAFSTIVDDVTYSENGTTLYVLRVTYDNSTHDNVVSIERIV